MDISDIDIYDDLDEFQEKEEKKSAELLELEKKYKESLETIESMEKEINILRKKQRIIEVNFQNLLDTAKREIKRKDDQIAQLQREKDDICFRRKYTTGYVAQKAKYNHFDDHNDNVPSTSQHHLVNPFKQNEIQPQQSFANDAVETELDKTTTQLPASPMSTNSKRQRSPADSNETWKNANTDEPDMKSRSFKKTRYDKVQDSHREHSSSNKEDDKVQPRANRERSRSRERHHKISRNERSRSRYKYNNHQHSSDSEEQYSDYHRDRKHQRETTKRDHGSRQDRHRRASREDLRRESRKDSRRESRDRDHVRKHRKGSRSDVERYERNNCSSKETQLENSSNRSSKRKNSLHKTSDGAESSKEPHRKSSNKHRELIKYESKSESNSRTEIKSKVKELSDRKDRRTPFLENDFIQKNEQEETSNDKKELKADDEKTKVRSTNECLRRVETNTASLKTNDDSKTIKCENDANCKLDEDELKNISYDNLSISSCDTIVFDIPKELDAKQINDKMVINDEKSEIALNTPKKVELFNKLFGQDSADNSKNDSNKLLSNVLEILKKEVPRVDERKSGNNNVNPQVLSNNESESSKFNENSVAKNENISNNCNTELAEPMKNLHEKRATQQNEVIEIKDDTDIDSSNDEIEFFSAEEISKHLSNTESNPTDLERIPSKAISSINADVDKTKKPLIEIIEDIRLPTVLPIKEILNIQEDACTQSQETFENTKNVVEDNNDEDLQDKQDIEDTIANNTATNTDDELDISYHTDITFDETDISLEVVSDDQFSDFEEFDENNPNSKQENKATKTTNLKKSSPFIDLTEELNGKSSKETLTTVHENDKHDSKELIKYNEILSPITDDEEIKLISDIESDEFQNDVLKAYHNIIDDCTTIDEIEENQILSIREENLFEQNTEMKENLSEEPIKTSNVEINDKHLEVENQNNLIDKMESITKKSEDEDLLKQLDCHKFVEKSEENLEVASYKKHSKSLSDKEIIEEIILLDNDQRSDHKDTVPSDNYEEVDNVQEQTSSKQVVESSADKEIDEINENIVHSSNENITETITVEEMEFIAPTVTLSKALDDSTKSLSIEPVVEEEEEKTIHVEQSKKKNTDLNNIQRTDQKENTDDNIQRTDQKEFPQQDEIVASHKDIICTKLQAVVSKEKINKDVCEILNHNQGEQEKIINTSQLSADVMEDVVVPDRASLTIADKSSEEIEDRKATNIEKDCEIKESKVAEVVKDFIEEKCDLKEIDTNLQSIANDEILKDEKENTKVPTTDRHEKDGITSNIALNVNYDITEVPEKCNKIQENIPNEKEDEIKKISKSKLPLSDNVHLDADVNIMDVNQIKEHNSESDKKFPVQDDKMLTNKNYILPATEDHLKSPKTAVDDHVEHESTKIATNSKTNNDNICSDVVQHGIDENHQIKLQNPVDNIHYNVIQREEEAEIRQKDIEMEQVVTQNCSVYINYYNKDKVQDNVKDKVNITSNKKLTNSSKSLEENQNKSDVNKQNKSKTTKNSFAKVNQSKTNLPALANTTDNKLNQLTEVQEPATSQLCELKATDGPAEKHCPSLEAKNSSDWKVIRERQPKEKATEGKQLPKRSPKKPKNFFKIVIAPSVEETRKRKLSEGYKIPKLKQPKLDIENDENGKEMKTQKTVENISMKEKEKKIEENVSTLKNKSSFQLTKSMSCPEGTISNTISDNHVDNSNIPKDKNKTSKGGHKNVDKLISIEKPLKLTTIDSRIPPYLSKDTSKKGNEIKIKVNKKSQKTQKIFVETEKHDKQAAVSINAISKSELKLDAKSNTSPRKLISSSTAYSTPLISKNRKSKHFRRILDDSSDDDGSDIQKIHSAAYQRNANEEMQPMVHELQLTANQLQPTASELHLKANELQPTSNELHLNANELQLMEKELQPTANELHLNEIELQPTANEIQPTTNELHFNAKELQPTENELQLNGNKLQPTASKLQPTINELHFNAKELQSTSNELHLNAIPLQPTANKLQPTINELHLNANELQTTAPTVITHELKRKRKKRTIVSVTTSNDVEVPKSQQPDMTTPPAPERVPSTPIQAPPTPDHAIFHIDPESSASYTALPQLNNLQDKQLADIDSRLQSMFQSPPYVADNQMSVVSRDLLSPVQQNTASSSPSHEEETSLNDDSFNSKHASSLETKCLSLGTSQYVVEKVSENVVNVFVTRKRHKKKTTLFSTSNTSNPELMTSVGGEGRI